MNVACCWVGWVLVRRLICEGLQADDSCCVEVAGEAGAACLLFGGDVTRGTDGDGFFEIAFAKCFDGSEVDEDELLIALLITSAKDKVGGFDVSVDDVVLMDESEDGEEVCEEIYGIDCTV